MRKKDENKHSLFINPIAMLIIAIIGILLTALIFYITYISFTTTKGTIHSDYIASPPGLVKGDWLSFWGCIFSALCTIVLACFALVQNVNLSKINEKKEKTDIFFAKKRFSAEFYSQIEFEQISFYKNGDGVLSIMFIIKDIGRCPPSVIRIKSFSIGRGSSVAIVSPSTESSCVFTSISGKDINVSSRKTTRDNDGLNKIYSASIPVSEKEVELFLGMVTEIISLNAERNGFSIEKVFLIASIEYDLVNPLEVETRFNGEMPLITASYIVHSIRSIKEGEDFVFRVVDSFVETLVYDFVGM